MPSLNLFHAFLLSLCSVNSQVPTHTPLSTSAPYRTMVNLCQASLAIFITLLVICIFRSRHEDKIWSVSIAWSHSSTCLLSRVANRLPFKSCLWLMLILLYIKLLMPWMVWTGEFETPSFEQLHISPCSNVPQPDIKSMLILEYMNTMVLFS